MPTSGEEPCSTARPCARGRLDGVEPQSAPPSTRTMPALGSTSTPVIAEVRSSDASSRLRGERAGVVAGALRRDPQPGGRGGADHRGDLVGAGGVGDGGGALVDGDVPGHPGGVVPGVAGQVDGAAAQPAQLGGAGVGGGRSGGGRGIGGLDGHDVFSSKDWPRSGRWEHSSAENLGVT